MSARGEGGFTLMELVVAMVIAGIVASVGIAGLNGARQRGQDSAARAALRVAQYTANARYVDRLDYSGATAAELDAVDPDLVTVPGTQAAPADGRTVSVTVNGPGAAVNPTTWNAAVRSLSGACFYVRLDTSGAVVEHVVRTAPTCTGAWFATFTGTPTPW